MGFWKKIGAALDALSADDKEKTPTESPEEQKKRLEKEESRQKYESDYKLKKNIQKMKKQIEELQMTHAEKFEEAKKCLIRGEQQNALIMSQACDQIKIKIGNLQKAVAALELKISDTVTDGTIQDTVEILADRSRQNSNSMAPVDVNGAFTDIDMSHATSEEISNRLNEGWDENTKKSRNNTADANVESETLKLAESEVLGEIAAKGNSSLVTETSTEAGEKISNSTEAQVDKGLKELEDLMDGLK